MQSIKHKYIPPPTILALEQETIEAVQSTVKKKKNTLPHFISLNDLTAIN